MSAKVKYICVTYFETLVLPNGSDFSANNMDGGVGNDRVSGYESDGFMGKEHQCSQNMIW